MRITTLDAVRGFAVMGILLMNIVSFGLPGTAYIDPRYYGGAEGMNRVVWALNFILADGKFRGLFTMMFGASTVLIAEAAVAAGQSAARVHYARLFWLFVIGMLHAYLIWYGDILVSYAVCGALAFLVWRWPPRALIAIGVALLLYKLAMGIAAYQTTTHIRDAANAPTATIAAKQEWADIRAQIEPPSAADRDAEIAAYRGGYAANLAERTRTAFYFQTTLYPDLIPDTLALMAIGMALFRLGFFSGQWSARSYQLTVLMGFSLTLPPYIALARWISRAEFDGIVQLATEPLHSTLLRPFMALAYAASVILFVQSGIARKLAARLRAVGRMAFSNYLGSSLICTTLFYGFGFGRFGRLERWQLYPVVAGVWALMLLWSQPWLARFHYGPFEWLWRSLARGKLQPMRRDQPSQLSG